MVRRGRIENEVVIVDARGTLPEGRLVGVRPLFGAAARPRPRKSGPSLYDRLRPVIGKAKGLPPDASVNIDHYLYGMPKR